MVTGYEDEDRTLVNNTPTAHRTSDLEEHAVDLDSPHSDSTRARTSRTTRTQSDVGTPSTPRPDASSTTGLGLKRRLSRNPQERQRRLSERQDRAKRREVPLAVVEQRVSNLAQGCLCLVLMTAPFEFVLGLIPKGVLAGLFWYMGTDALLSSGVTEKILYLLRDPQAVSPSNPLNRVRKSRIMIFLLVELLGFGATFAVTQTIAAIGFPIIIMALVPVRIWVVPMLGFGEGELEVLDGPVASAFVSLRRCEVRVASGIELME